MSHTNRQRRRNVTHLHCSNRRLRHVEMGRVIVSANPDEILVVYGLGSCIGVTAYDPIAHVGGLAHCQLPSPATGVIPSVVLAATFTDAGIDTLLSAVRALGGSSKTLQIGLFGGASPLRMPDRSAIGRRNYFAARKALWRVNQLVFAERVLGRRPRTVYLEIGSGATLMDSLGREEWICQ